MATRLAVIGFQHFRVLQIVDKLLQLGGVEIVGLAEPDTARREEMTRRFGVPAYADYRELLAAVRPEGAVLGTINSEKADAVIACIEAGVHVMVDKPLCTELAQLDAIERAIRARLVRLNMVYAGGYGGTHAPRQVIREHLGDVVQITLASTHRWYLDPAIGMRADWNYSRKQFGGSIVVDAINNLNTVRWLTDKDIVAVTASHVNRAMPEHPEFEDNFAVLAELEGGATASISFSWLTPDAEATHGRSSMFVVGTEGVLDIRSTVPERASSERYTGGIRLAETEVVLTTRTEPAHRITMPKVAGPSYEEDFLAGVRDPAYQPMLSPEWTIESTRISLAARQSADEHRRIALR